jgi:hypothetical protein
MLNPFQLLVERSRMARANWALKAQIERVEAFLAARSTPGGDGASPVLFFNASTRIHRLSINGAFGMLAAWALRARGVPVRYVACARGMEQCVLGTSREDYEAPPPCDWCVKFSSLLFPREGIIPLLFDDGLKAQLEGALAGMSLDEMIDWEYSELPLGQLTIPSLRWALRSHHLPDEAPIRRLLRRYLVSAASLAARFRAILEEHAPRALVVFNGISFPEAVARAVALERGVPVVTHEVGLRPYSAFFSHEHATFRALDLPSDFQLDEAEEARLQAYLDHRFQGRFSMAGIRFWPQMEPLPEELQAKIGAHRQMIPIFTNVIFDTSQVHANVLFEHMFAWLEALRPVIRSHPETLFVLRAHPDEDRPGKESRESVAQWVEAVGLGDEPNVVFIGPGEHISSYELIRLAKFVLVYNSSIGLEASIMGAAVLCAGRGRYTQLPTVYFPQSREEYFEQLEHMLSAEEIQPPPQFARNARRFLSYELYNASLDLAEFMQPYPRQAGMVLFTDFEPQRLLESPALEVITRGILDGESFLMPRAVKGGDGP